MPTYSGNTVTVDSASENINISLNQGNAIIVSVEAAAFSGTVDFQSTIDGETYTNHPYISYHAASPTRSVAQLSSPTTYAAYVILPPVTQARIVVTYSSGSLEVIWREVDYKTSIADADADTTYTAGDGLTLTSTDFDLDAALTTVTSIHATDLIIGEDAQTAIDFGTVNEIDFKADNAVRLTLDAGALYPFTTNQIDLGTASLEFKDAFFDGTVTADAFAGPLTGNVTGDASGTAATVTGGTQAAITTLANVTTVGELTSGSIASGFGAIDNGSNTITTTGAVATGELTVTGDVNINTDFYETDLSVYGADIGEGDATGQIAIKDSAAFGASPKAGIIFVNEHTSGSQAVMGGIGVHKNDGADSNYGSYMSFATRAHGAVSVRALTLTENQNVVIEATKKLYLDGSTGAVGDTYIYQESDDDLHIVVGGSAMIQIDQDAGGSGKAAIGYGVAVAPSGLTHHLFGGDFTSDGTSNAARGERFQVAVTGASGDTEYLAQTQIHGTIATQTATEDIGVIAGLYVNEPNIADNLTGDITVAATLYIASVPDEGETNAAIYVAAGNIQAAAGQVIATTPRAQNGLTLVNSTDSQTMTLYPDTATTMTWYYGGVALSVNSSSNVSLTATKKLHFDSFGDTYIYEESGDDLHIVVGNTSYIQIDQDDDSIGYGGAAPYSGYKHRFGGTKVSAGAWDRVTGSVFDATVTAVTGDTNHLSQISAGAASGGSLITMNNSETVGVVATAFFSEPSITKGTDTVTVAASVYVASAPTEGATNASAIFKGEPATATDPTVLIGDVLAHSTASARHKLHIGNTNGRTELYMGQSASAGLLMDWVYNGTEGDSYGRILTQGNDKVLQIGAGNDIGFGTSTPRTLRGGASFAASNTDVWAFHAVAGDSAAMIISTDGAAGAASRIMFEQTTSANDGECFDLLWNLDAFSFAVMDEDDLSRTQLMQIGSGGMVAIGDTANANMTTGLTINQGANSNQILALKSSGVAHGTSKILTTKETDDFAVFQKSSATGGLIIETVEDGASTTEWMRFGVLGRDTDTSKNTGAAATFTIFTSQHDSAGSNVDVDSDGNVFAVRARVSGSNLVRVLVDEAGDLYSVTSAQTFDDYDDMALIETYDAARSGSLKEQIKADFGRTMLMDEATLIEAGVLGDTMANGGLTNQTQLSRVLTGGVRQLNQKHMSLAEKVEGLEVELIEAKKQLAAISA